MSTLKQKLAFKEVLNGSTISKAMLKAGYSETTASTTGKLTNTDGWKELMDQHLPDKLLAKVHKEGLEASDKIYDSNGEVVVEKPDYSVRHRYLDSAYKLKGRYPDGEIGGDRNFNVTQIIINPSNGNTGNQSNSEAGTSLASTE